MKLLDCNCFLSIMAFHMSLVPMGRVQFPELLSLLLRPVSLIPKDKLFSYQTSNVCGRQPF